MAHCIKAVPSASPAKNFQHLISPAPAEERFNRKLLQLEKAMRSADFDSIAAKLERNIYGSAKGAIRLGLLMEDIDQYIPHSTSQPLSILDIGGGSGHLARRFASAGHHVLLCDSSSAMLEKASQEISQRTFQGKIELLHADFLSPAYDFHNQFDLVLMHGSAEWTLDPDLAIIKACRCTKADGFLSLLVFNKDRLQLKQGINGHLLYPERHVPRTKLTPPGARSPNEINSILAQMPGSTIIQSGIRIFHGFFRHIDTSSLSVEQWIEQEKLYFRQHPFSSLGEHTHFIWKHHS